MVSPSGQRTRRRRGNFDTPLTGTRAGTRIRSPGFYPTSPLALPDARPTLRRMYRIIGGDGREYGPVALEQIQLWIAQRRAGPGTLVRPESSTEWSALNQLAEFASDLAALEPRSPSGPAVVPPPLPGGRGSAGTGFPANSANVSPTETNATGTPAVASAGNADPRRESTASEETTMDPAATGDASEAPVTTADDPLDALGYIQRCLTRNYELRIRASISRGYDIAARQVGLAMIATLTTGLLQAAIGRIPAVGAAVLALEGVFDGGLALFFVVLARGGVATMGDAFAGFRIQFSQLLMFSVARSMVALSVLMVTLVPVLALLADVLSLTDEISLDTASAVRALQFSPLVILPAVYLLVSWTFVPFLIIDRELGFWDAMELSRRVARRRWFKLFFLHVAFLPIHLAGLMCFGVGVIYTSALKRATIAGIYDDVFRE